MSTTPSDGIKDFEQLREGDTRALRRLFDRHYPGLVSVVYVYVNDEETSKDIAQEVFVDLWSRRHTLHIEQSLGAYLHRAAINRALNHLKAQQRYQTYDDDTPWSHLPDTTEQDLQWKERQDELEERLREAIEQLPEKCRVVFLLSRFERMTHREIAERLGISVKTIENQLLRAMRLLRQALEKHWHLPLLLIFWIKGS